MKLCCCGGNLVPLGRTQMTMIDGGVTELIVLLCETSKTIRFEQAAVSTADIPDIPN